MNLSANDFKIIYSLSCAFYASIIGGSVCVCLQVVCGWWRRRQRKQPLINVEVKDKQKLLGRK